MSLTEHLPTENRVLSMISSAEYRRLRPNLEQVVLQRDTVLYTPGDVITHIYFPGDSIVSTLLEMDKRPPVEVAMHGNEGVVGVAAYLSGVTSGNHAIVRATGSAQKVDVVSLRNHVDRRGQLQSLLHKSAHALLMQITQSGACNRFHSIKERLILWLLMTQDRIGTNSIRATQENIACMMGVRRSGITHAASSLQTRQLIDYRRGHILILDRPRLRSACCNCYVAMKNHYDSFLK
jgi:CRP-like cAMP-binding protein